MIDFTQLEPPSSPNAHLVCPEGYCREGAAHALAEPAPASAKALITAWREVLEARPRTRIVEESEDGLAVHAVQKSAVFGFADDIHARAVPLEDGKAALAVYSASRKGYYDFGVNARRVSEWLDETRARIERMGA